MPNILKIIEHLYIVFHIILSSLKGNCMTELLLYVQPCLFALQCNVGVKAWELFTSLLSLNGENNWLTNWEKAGEEYLY